MTKRLISAQDVCSLLNEFLELDPKCAQTILSHRVKCNDAVACHSTIQVQQFIDDKFPKVGIIGLINGVFGKRADGRGIICADIDTTGKILNFKLTPVSHTEY
jgi:hypothetical protein